VKKQKISSFRDYIRRMFIINAIIPVFCVTCVCMAIFIGLQYYSIHLTNIEANERVSSVLQDTVSKYKQCVLELSKRSSLITQKIDSDRLLIIRRTMKQMAATTGYSGELYILDVELKQILIDGSDVPIFLSDEAYGGWGILREISENPQKVSVKIETGAENYLCIGSCILKEGSIIGYVIVMIPSDEFSVLLTKVSPQTVISDKNGWIYLSNSYDFTDVLGRFDRSIETANGFTKYNGRTWYIINSTIENNLIRICTADEEVRSMTMFTMIFLVVMFIFIAITIIVYISSNRLARESTSDIGDIAEAFEQVKAGNLEKYIDVSSIEEFQKIGEAYNIMLDGLKENKELVERVAFAQVKQLESQFNPHFIFNTLDNIRFMAKIDVEASDKMIVALSSILRYSISNAQEEVTVAEDMKYTEYYLSILKIRFNRRFTYKTDIEESIGDCLIPKLMIQPLIENSVKYGFVNRDCLNVVIKAYAEADRLIFICRDDGNGMDENQLEEIRSNIEQPVNVSSHMGIYNVHRRIQLMYHEDCGVRIESKKGEGTTLTLVLPKQEKGRKNV
jgi:two-component system sensor histidine kinase YesM